MNEQQDFDFSITEEELQEFQHLVDQIENSDTSNFIDLAQELDLSLKDDFVAANFAGIDLSNANLRGVNFSYSNLSGANFSNTDLSDADFSGANLSNADLSGANFSNTDLNGANLSGANLIDVNLNGANLNDVNLNGVTLNDVNLLKNFLGTKTQPQHSFRTRKIIKRCIDIIGATIMLILTAPVIIIIAIAIKVDSPGPIFFRQKSFSLDGKEFRIWKFRSMVVDAEQVLTTLEFKNEMKDAVFFKMKNDPRVTKVGKFLRRYSLDELPQLFNVLLGEMSLVTPRHFDAEKLQTKHLIYLEFLLGFIGLWKSFSSADIEENFED